MACIIIFVWIVKKHQFLNNQAGVIIILRSSMHEFLGPFLIVYHNAATKVQDTFMKVTNCQHSRRGSVSSITEYVTGGFTSGLHCCISLVDSCCFLFLLQNAFKLNFGRIFISFRITAKL